MFHCADGLVFLGRGKHRGLCHRPGTPVKRSGEGYVGSTGLSGRGEATHLGRSSLNVDVYTDFLSSGLFLSSGGRLESASGDSLDFIFDEEAYDFDPATGVVNAMVTFSGGSGRFQHVSGSADVLIVFDMSFYPALFFHVVVDGSIDY